MRQRFGLALAGGLAGMAVGLAGVPGLGVASAARAAPAATQGSVGTRFDPVRFVGRWRVAAPGEDSDAILRVSDGIELFADCGEAGGAWTGNPDGRLAVTIDEFSSACLSRFGHPGAPTWLTRAASGRMTASGVELLDAGGHVLAELTPGPAPTRRSDTSAATDVPTPSAGLVARLRNAGTLPAGLTPATAATVVGQWRPDPQTKAPSSLTVKADGAWVGNDGCNDSGGAWLMATGGYLTATTGLNGLVGCAGSQVPTRWGVARRVGFGGTTMVLVDVRGKVLGRLVRDTTPACRPGQLSGARQSQGFGRNNDAMAVILHIARGSCLFSDTLTVTAVDQAGKALAPSARVTSARPALISTTLGSTQIVVNANYGRDATNGRPCVDNAVKPYALRVTSPELGSLLVVMRGSLRTCRGQLDPTGFVESFGG